jgi:hypothetical protein
MRNLLRSQFLEAARVALVVGTILLLINQYDALFGQQNLRWLPAMLTYCVPFSVFLLGKRSGGECAE